jgi:Methyltransferase domain
VNSREFLTGLHAAISPRSYLQIGVGYGHDLTAAGTRTIAVAPVPRVTAEVSSDVQLVSATSNDFFAGPDALAWFDTGTVDLTFINGLHVLEYALRDFMNAERVSSPGGVIVLNDMLPRMTEEASRDRSAGVWAGDVYKVAAVLETYRPDLIVIRLNTAPTGLAIVVGLDPTNEVLSEKYEQILTDFVTPDPQDVPRVILHRSSAANPAQVLASTSWADLVAARNAGEAAPASLSSLLELRGTAGFVPDPLWDSTKPATKVAKKKSGAKPGGGGKGKGKTTAKKKAAQKMTVKRALRGIKRRLS